METALKTLVSAVELLALPHDGARHELIRGELITMSPTGTLHGVTASRADHRVRQHVEANDLGEVTGAETGFLIETDPDTVRVPDCAFISKAHIPPGGMPHDYFPGAPDLAVKVISPDDRFAEVERKVAMWFDAGVRRVWVLNPLQRSAADYASPFDFRVLLEDEFLEGGEVVPGYRCCVGELYPRW